MSEDLSEDFGDIPVPAPFKEASLADNGLDPGAFGFSFEIGVFHFLGGNDPRTDIDFVSAE